MGKIIKLSTIIILAFLIIVLILQNTQVVETKILFWILVLPRAVLLLITSLIGFTIGVIFTLRITKKQRKTKKIDTRDQKTETRAQDKTQ